MSGHDMLPSDRNTLDVFEHHLHAFAQGVDALVSDYSERSTLILQDRTITGLAEIRGYFEHFLGSIPAGFWDAFHISRQAINGDIAYVLWSAKPFVLLATDTLLVRDGKILTQTFTAFS